MENRLAEFEENRLADFEEPVLKEPQLIETGMEGAPFIEAEEPDRGFWAELGASLETGTANVVAGLAGSIEKLSGGKGWIGEHAADLAEASRWAAFDPENLPSPTDDAKTFVAQALGGTIPFMTATVGATLIAGPYAGAAVAFSVEGENAYQNAIKTGATEKEANTERFIVGGLNAFIEMAQVSKILKSGKSIKPLVHSMRNKVWQKAIQSGKKVTIDMVKSGFEEGLEEALQGTVSEGVPWLIRGVHPEGTMTDFMIRRGMEAAGGAIGGVLFGGATGMLSQQVKVDKLNSGQEITSSEEIPSDKLYQVVEITEEGERVETPDSEMFPEYQAGFPSEEEAQAYIDARGTMKMGYTQVGKYEIKGVETPVKKFTKLIKETRKLTDEEMKIVEKRRSMERAKRSQEAGDIIRSGVEEDLLYTGMSKLSGKLEALPTFTPIEQMGKFTQEEAADLRMQIRSNPKFQGREFEMINTENAFNKLWKKGERLTDSEVSLMEKQFGSEFAAAIVDIQGKTWWKKAQDLINLPRTTLASVDVSGPGRQGFVWAARHPLLWSRTVGTSYKIFFGKDSFANAEQIEADIKTSKYYDLSQKSKLELTEWQGVGRTFSKKEEQFMSSYAERIPFGIGKLVKRSERAYVSALNKLRMDLFTHYSDKWEGTSKADQDYKDLAKFINHTTGRGDLKGFEKMAPFLNAAFFAPRFVSSRIEVPIDVFTSTPAVRKIIFADLVAFVGSGLGALALLSMVKGVKVEKDPRSSDFGKIRIGNTRLDFWAGYSPIVRLCAQAMSGQRKSTDTGKIQDVDAQEILGRFVQSKFSPPIAMLTDIWRGENYIGEEMNWELSTVMREAKNRLVPLAFQDTYDALKYQGLMGGLIAGPAAFHGIGAQTYPLTKSKELVILKERLSKETFGKSWDDIGPEAQKALTEYYPQITLMSERIRQERTSYDFIGKQLEEQDKAGKSVMKGLAVKSELEDLGVDIGGLSRRISSNWFLNDERYGEYQTSVETVLNKVLPQIVKHPRWRGYPKEAKRELLSYLIDEAKKLARQNIIDTANRKDLVSYMEKVRGK